MPDVLSAISDDLTTLDLALSEAGRVLSAKNEADLVRARDLVHSVVRRNNPYAKESLSEADLSLDQKQQLVAQALRAALPTQQVEVPVGSCYVRALYDDSVVYEVYDGEDCDLYQRSYSINADGSVTLGDPQPVQAVVSYEPAPPDAEDMGESDPLAEAVTKSEGAAGNFPASDYAYVPDPSKPSTWKLRLTATPGGQPDAGMVGAAAAALGPGYRGQKVQLPAADRAAVVRKVRAAWRQANPDKSADEMPSGIKEAHEVFWALVAELDVEPGDDGVDEASSSLPPAMKARARAAWKKANPGKADSEMPPAIREDAEEMPSESLTDLVSELVLLNEAGIPDEGPIPIKVIQAGWGSSGYYAKEVLMRDGPKIFPPGTHMYFDHPTRADEVQRPERSVRDLAAAFDEGAHWDDDGWDGPGLYAAATPLPLYRPLIKQLAKHIGVSIRAGGRYQEGEAEGQKGRIITSLEQGHSVDFVTRAGAGGKVLALMESAGREPAPRKEERPMPDPIDERQDGDKPDVFTENAQMRAQLQEMQARMDRMREREQIREAADLVASRLSRYELRPTTKERLVRDLGARFPLTEDGDIDKAAYLETIDEAIRAEVKYLESVGAGAVRNMGYSTPSGELTLEDAQKRLQESMGSLIGGRL